MSKAIAAGLALACAAALGEARASEGIPSPLTLDWCLERARTASPQIEVDAARRDAARERVRPAGSLEDPRVGYEASNLPVGDFDFNSTPLSGHQLGLRQKIPFPGVLGNRREAARATASAAEHRLENRVLVTSASVEAAWAELGFAQRAHRITERNIELLRQLTAVAEAKYRVGDGLQQDVLRAQVELTERLEERLRRDASIHTAAARLAALLDLSPEQTLPATAALEDASPLPELAPLVERVEERSPYLLGLAARVEAAERRVRVAELEGYPDFDLGLGYRIRRNAEGDPVDGDDFFSAGVTLRLPIDRRKWRSRIAERRAEARVAEAEWRAARADTHAELRALHASLVRADSEVALVRSGLLPQASQSLESSRSGYEVGRIDFLSLLDSQVRLQNAELREVRAHADRRAAFAALEAAAGVDLR